MKWENLLLFPFFGYIAYPWLALVPAGAFAAAFFWKRRNSARLAGILWAGYAIYESLMKARILCSGECNIRVDLLLIIPLLWIVSIVAVVQLFLRRRPHGAA
jgi:hypothetical protein